MADKVALISGANKGIGKEVARQLGKKGFKVLLGSRDIGRGETAAEELRKEGVDAQAIQLDVTDEGSVVKAIEQIGICQQIWDKSENHLGSKINASLVE